MFKFACESSGPFLLSNFCFSIVRVFDLKPRLHDLSLLKMALIEFAKAMPEGMQNCVPIFGDAIFEVAPNVLDDFWTFNLEAWKMHSKYPRFAAPRLFEAKDRSVKAFADYLSLPRDQRPGTCWLVEQLEMDMEELGITEMPQCGAMLFSLQNL